MEALSTVIPGNMVKSRRASQTPCLAASSQSSPPTPAGLLESAAAPVMPEISALQRPLPLNRHPNFPSARRLESVLNRSDEQSSNDGDEENSELATSPFSTFSPADPAHISVQLPASACSSMAAADRAADLRDTLSTSASSADAVLAFQRWRISSLKALYTEELQNVLKEAQQDEARLLALEEEMEKKEKQLVHALADSAQLRAQLCAMEDGKGGHHVSSEVEILELDLVRALDRATSSEAEVERYNKEIRKLRDRLKSMEDEASRLDTELKADISFLQKEKDGIAKENHVLLEQLARKDDEILSQTKEIRNLKSVLACLKISRLELERLKSLLQGNAAQQMNFSMGNTALENQMELDCYPSKVLDLLQRATACFKKNDDLSGAKVSSEETCVVQPNLSQNEWRCINEAADCKQSLGPGQTSLSHPLVNDGHTKGFQHTHPPADSSIKLRKLFIVSCWKWRWVAAATEVQALYKRLNTLESISKVSLQQIFSASFLENLRACLFQGVHPSANLLAPETLEKVFSLFTFIWNVSSQSAQQEREAFLRNRQIEHLFEVMKRWMQNALKKRQLERVIAHWLRFLLQSRKSKIKHQKANMLAPTPDIKLRVSKPTASHLNQTSCHNQREHLADNAVPIKRSTINTEEKISENHTRLVKKEHWRNPKKDSGFFQKEDLEAFQEWLHNRLVTLEALIVKEAKSWHHKHLGDRLCAHHESTSAYSAPTDLVWRICCEMEHLFFEARNQIMSFLGLWNKLPSCLHTGIGATKPMVAGSSQLLNCKIRSTVAKHQN